MRYIFTVITFFLLTGCLNSELKPTLPENKTEFELMSIVTNNDTNKTNTLLKQGYSAIELAVRLEDYNMTKKLLELGSNPNVTIAINDSNITLVSLAASLEKTDILKLLFKYGISAKTSNQYNTMIAAISKNRKDNLSFLLDNDFDINARSSDENNTLLMFSSNQNETSDMTKFLLEHGADVNGTNINGSSALLIAINKNPNDDNILYLLEYDADVNHKGENNTTSIAKTIVQSKSTTVLKELIVHGADIESKIFNLASPLLLSMKLDKYYFAKIIAKNMKNKPEEYLYLAIKYGKQRMFNLLLDNGFSIKKIELPKYAINMYLANTRYKELKEYFESYGLDTFDLRYISIQAQKEIVKIVDSLYKENTLTDKQKQTIAESLSAINEKEKAYQWFKTITVQNQELKWACLFSADVGKTDIKSCKRQIQIYKKDNEFARLSWFSLLVKNYDDVVSFGKRAIEENNDNYTYANIGHAYLLQNKKAKAYEAYKNYFVKMNNTESLHAIKNDFEILKLNYPEKTDLFDGAYKYCLDTDTQVFLQYH